MMFVLKILKRKDFWFSFIFTLLSIPSIFVIALSNDSPETFIMTLSDCSLTGMLGMFLAFGFFIGSFSREVIHLIEEVIQEEKGAYSCD
jgi:hypothetical protein